jgi:Zn-dependent protease
LSEINPGVVFILLVVLAFSLSFHELAHAWTADRLGDSTARLEGRVSMNPAVHVDIIGTIIFPLIGIVSAMAGQHIPLLGWARPVPVNVGALSRPRRDMILIAAAGPASNVLLALATSIAFRIYAALGAGSSGAIEEPLLQFFSAAFRINIGLAVFNMIPIPPLDGGNVLSNLLPPRQGYAFDGFMRPYGFILLYALMLTGVLQYIVGPPMAILASLLLL